MGMSKEEEQQQARLEQARAIGLFRYMLIREAADPALSTRQRGKLVRAIAAREHADPSGRPVRLTRWTLDRWVRAWHQVVSAVHGVHEGDVHDVWVAAWGTPPG